MHHALKILAAGSEAVLFGEPEHGFDGRMAPGSHFVRSVANYSRGRRRPTLGLGREVFGEQLGQIAVQGEAAGWAASSSGMVTVICMVLRVANWPAEYTHKRSYVVVDSGLVCYGHRMLDPRYFNNLIDANVLHTTGGPEGAALDEIQKLHHNGAFPLLLPHSVKAEIEHPNTPAEVKRKAARFIYSRPVQLTAPERATHTSVLSHR